MDFKKITKKHKAFLGSEFQIYFTPGRVNLIGEHVDYQGGRVFPVAINFGTYAFVSKREDSEIHFISDNFLGFGEKTVRIDNITSSLMTNEKYISMRKLFSSRNNRLDFHGKNAKYYNTSSDLDFKHKDKWVNFPKGMIKYFLESGIEFSHGLNILIYGDLPKASGLSSSASLEVLIGLILKEEYSVNTDMLEIAQIARYVENSYINVNCGIMDQFSVAMGKKDHAMYLDTSSLHCDYIPLKLGEYSLLITNTNKSRSLAGSKYNERTTECSIALDIINRKIKKTDFITGLNSDEFLHNKELFHDENIANRVEHIVFENERTIHAVEALKASDMISFGKLMNESHDSLRDLYEVSCKELDVLVKSFRKHGAIGSRMTGAGFGGCTISLVKTTQISDIISKVKHDYFNEIGYHASFYPVKVSDGAKKLESGDLL